MASVTYDRQSFMVEGRRVWLVSGAIHYCRTPRELWRERLRAAKQAGLNCIETYVFWNLHESEPGVFDFEGDKDLRAFVRMIGEEGMYCILRPGPYVCSEWDFGGLPAWLHRVKGMEVRVANEPFMEATSRYLRKVLEQVRDLQVTSPRRDGQAGAATSWARSKASASGSGSASASAAASAKGGGRGAAKSSARLSASTASTASTAARVGAGPVATRSVSAGSVVGGYSGQAGGPILLMQAENEWFCHNPEQGETYLHPIVRYLRESGCEVPIFVCNNLWQRVEGAFDMWNAARDLPQTLRQLGVVQPDAPRMVSEYWCGWFDAWGEPHSTRSNDEHLYRMVGTLATGSMFNLYMFHGGTNFGFWGGRTVSQGFCHMTTSYDYDAPLLEAGGRGEKYNITKRVCMFASHFGHVLAHAEVDRPHTVVAADEADHPLSVMHLGGSQGQAVFLLRSANDRRAEVNLLLPNGLTLPVSLGDERAAWLLLDTNLGGIARLDYTNLRPWAFVNTGGGRLLVLFGPAGSTALLSVDGTHIQATVPAKGDPPAVERLDGLTVAILNTPQADAAYLHRGGLTIGANGLDPDGRPLSAKGVKTMYLVSLDGSLDTRTDDATRKPPAPKLATWQAAPLGPFLDGTHETYQTIDGPASLETLACDYGYGFYRIGTGKGAGGDMLAPGAGDRLHVFVNGRREAILGVGPGGTQDPTPLSLQGDVVVLADNLGRYNYGQHVGKDLKGLPDHLYEAEAVPLDDPAISNRRPPDPFELTGLAMQRRRGPLPMTRAYTWTIKPRNRKPVIFEIRGCPRPGMVLVNGTSIAYYAARDSADRLRLMLDPVAEVFTGGKNEVTFALLDPPPPDDAADAVRPAEHFRLIQLGNATTNRGAWAFAKWGIPADDAFTKLPSSLPDVPAWFRTTFKISDTRCPLWLEPIGMSKGQLYLNGHNIGRFWVNDPTGKPVPPQSRYYLPEPWLNENGENILTIFDEHGRAPKKCRLVYEENGPYG